MLTPSCWRVLLESKEDDSVGKNIVVVDSLSNKDVGVDSSEKIQRA